MRIAIQRVRPSDADMFRQIAADVFDKPISPDHLHAYLAETSHRMVLAILDHQVIGQAAAVLHHHPDKPTELYIDEVGVTPKYRQQGVAQSMLAELIAWGRELGCVSAWLGTEIDNDSAKGLYARYAPAEPILMYQWEL